MPTNPKDIAAELERLFPARVADATITQVEIDRDVVLRAMRRAMNGMQQLINSNPKGAH